MVQYRACASESCTALVTVKGRCRHCPKCRRLGIRSTGNQHTVSHEPPAYTTQVDASGISTIPPPLVHNIAEKDGEQLITKTTSERVRTLEDLIRVCEIDTGTWEIVEWHANKWEMGWKDKDAIAHAQPLFQIKARLRKKVLVIAARVEIEALKEAARLDIVKPHSSRPVVIINEDADNMLEIDIFDLHLGKLAWARETGYQDYDLGIARRLFEQALEALIARTASHAFAEVLLPIGNDFFNADNLNTETTHGTRQDCDGRFHKTAAIGRAMLVAAIERLRAIAPVAVVVVPGNHDQLAAWHLGDSLECYFHRDADVRIDNTPTLRKYHEFGQVMLMFTHGNKGRQLDYPLLMATEQPNMWGRTKYREAHIGHLHKTHAIDSPSVKENHGARVRVLSSLCAADAWHSEQTFVGNLRQAEAFVWSKDEGQIAHATFTALEV